MSSRELSEWMVYLKISAAREAEEEQRARRTAGGE